MVLNRNQKSFILVSEANIYLSSLCKIKNVMKWSFTVMKVLFFKIIEKLNKFGVQTFILEY